MCEYDVANDEQHPGVPSGPIEDRLGTDPIGLELLFDLLAAQGVTRIQIPRELEIERIGKLAWLKRA